MPSVMFVCEGNRFRSQVAEALFNAWAPAGWSAVSGGTNPKPSVHPKAVDMMAEIGIDISRQRPKAFDLAVAASAWRVIAMCELGACPVDVAEKTEHWEVPDPADVPPDQWTSIRDEIAERVKALIREIARTTPPPKGDGGVAPTRGSKD